MKRRGQGVKSADVGVKRTKKLQSNYLHDRLFSRRHHRRLEARGLNGRVRIFQPVTRHRGGDEAALRNHPGLHALDPATRNRNE